ncbi:MAG TPA: ABC transporter permease [Methanomicrobia archaeon]|nr:ABC transporter permease [Methanomicrobia archaeon]
MFQLSLNFLLHNKTRTFLTTTGIAIGIIVFLMLSAGATGTIQRSLNLYRVQSACDLIVMNKEFTPQQITSIQKLDGIDIAEPAIIEKIAIIDNFYDIIALPRYSTLFKIPFPEYRTILVPNFLSQRWKIEDNSVIEVTYVTPEKRKTVSLPASVFSSKNTDIPLRAIIDLKTGQDLFGIYANTILIRVNPTADINVLKQKIKNIVGNCDFQTYEDIFNTVKEKNQNFLIFKTIITEITFFIAGIGILNEMLLSIEGQKREIGILKSIGFTSGQIVEIYLTQLVILGILGTLLGIPLSLFMIKVIYGTLEYIQFFDIIIGITLSFFWIFLFAFYPLYKAKKSSVVDCLKRTQQ